MRYIQTDWNIPYYNFALEEYLINEAPEDSYLFFYIHKPSIIVGKYQNTIEEINKEFVDEHDIIVARRISGGGAVYHDEGNLNFSFVQKADKEDVNNFEKFTRPIIEALNELGVKAELSGRNDILVDGKKISGNAQYYANGRILSHGTLLFNSEMSNLTKALKANDLKIKSKGVKSVKSRVANIKDYMDQDMSIYELKNYLLEYISNTLGVEEYVLSQEELKKIEDAAENKFSKWEWNWGKSPAFEISKVDKFSCGLINVKLNVRKGKIKDCKIYGDFFTRRELEELENFLCNQTYEQESLKKALQEKEIDLEDYFQGIDPEEFAEFITT
ncbi:lipoate--protein ligase [Natranaerobius thermophilus]|uniref:lipoate--protein ligase n=1 Tax=Natranaerobius thermophilus (strain ATCC BAA-1301 / DSM 18059 / JW/NM-WN-LF) TaxID=457570 RepID=B2A7X8_NATTJ|nr:lipoate--protein ligase [Natranaerobius thermophilus]ACB85750.1 lipoyltransferase and lipoate-protein ligase [Natranaerobius thermophilus JW/NM-WN-LF]